MNDRIDLQLLYLEKLQQSMGNHLDKILEHLVQKLVAPAETGIVRVPDDAGFQIF